MACQWLSSTDMALTLRSQPRCRPSVSCSGIPPVRTQDARSRAPGAGHMLASMADPQAPTANVTKRRRGLDAEAIAQSLDEHGYAVTPRLVTVDECDAVVRDFDDDGHYRSTIDMRR